MTNLYKDTTREEEQVYPWTKAMCSKRVGKSVTK